MKEKEKFVGYENHEYNPIVRKETQKILVKLLKERQPKRILEVGTFIGYSASVMLETCPNAFLTTLEKDEKNFEYAKQNLTELGFVDRVKLVNCDAINFLEQASKAGEKFDFVFLDGPKGQYIKYFPFIKEMLVDGGVLVTDDIMFYGLVSYDGHIEHKHRTIVNNLRKYISLLKEDNDFDTQIYDIEDGLSVSVKKHN